MLLVFFLISYTLDCANKGSVEMLEGVPMTVYALWTLTLHSADQNV
jgi:hypothetical protein